MFHSRLDEKIHRLHFVENLIEVIVCCYLHYVLSLCILRYVRVDKPDTYTGEWFVGSSVSPSASRRCCGLSTIKPSVFLWPTKILLATVLKFLALVIK